MMALRKQRTISSTVAVEGFGFWSGRDVRLEFRPAEPNTGVIFVRRDMARPARIPARVEHRIEAPRRTVLSHAGGTVEMIEHVMAALAGLGVDNCEVWTDQPEMPGVDGSALPFTIALESAGIVEQDAVRPRLMVQSVTRLGNDESWLEARPSPQGGGFSAKFRLDYGPNNQIGRQTLEMVITPSSFRRELASARTFMLQEEADWLIARGLGTRVTPKSVLVFDKEGVVDNELRFEDECVRHKILDLVGDLALTGVDLVGHVIAHRSGHRLNAEMARALLNEEKLTEGYRRSA
jgi:UDP-3-O-[3-hydroxymyristoyl] N-acetylglucosamine deacetylase